MKRLILPIVLLTFSAISSAQKSFFDEAIRNGRTPNGFFCATNHKGKSMSVEEMTQYAKSQNYIIGRIATAQNTRFGTQREIFYKFEFMYPNDKNYENYVYYVLNGNSGGALPKTTTGRVYLGYDAVKKYHKASWDTTYLATYDNVKWTGKVVNGLIEGTGTGWFKHNSVYCYINGTFKDGLPMSEVTTRVIIGPVGVTKINYTFKIDAEHVGALAKHADIPACKKHLEIYYRHNLPKLNNAYKRAADINKSNYKQLYKQFIESFSAEEFYDNFNAVMTGDPYKKCLELLDLHTVMKGLYTKPRGYWGTGWTGGVYWYQERYNEDWQRVDDAETLCSRHNGPFKAFFASVKSDLSRLKNEIDHAAKSDYKEYVAAWHEAKARRQSSSGSSSVTSFEPNKSSSSTSSKPADTSVNPETVSIPSYNFDGDWYVGNHRYGDVKNTSGENQTRDLKFSDGTKGKVVRVYNVKESFWTSNDNRYRTLQDAIEAEYVYQKYGLVREKGRRSRSDIF